MINVKNLTKIYNSKNAEKTVALSDISFSLPSTGLVFIIGKSGSGKSTLLNILACLDSPISGSVKFNNLELATLSERDSYNFRGQEVGFIFQYYYLIDDLTVRENILLSNDISKTDNDIEELLVDLELKEIENKYPFELSGGQCQRVGIARALLKKPSVILADEPTGALDSKTSTQIMDLLKEVAKDRLVIMVTHNKELAEENSNKSTVLASTQRDYIAGITFGIETDTLDMEGKILSTKTVENFVFIL